MIFRAESAHQVIKRDILSSQADLITTCLSIEQSVANQIQNIKANAAKDRIRTPLNLDRAQYSACFNYITTPVLRQVHANYTSAKRPLQPCTGVFTATTGLLCAHRVDYIQEEGLSLLPDDFHLHWYWDRYAGLPKPLLEPLCIVTYIPSASGRTYSTRRIPSGWEASETRLRRCGSCRGIGHNKASIKCPVNIHNLRAEFSIKPTTQPSPEPLPSLSPSPESAIQPNPELVDTHPIWPYRPELIYRRYIDEKEDWLRAHPDVQPAQYRTARGLEQYSKAWLNENRRYLGFRRLDLETETFLKGRAKWTDKEIEAYLD